MAKANELEIQENKGASELISFAIEKGADLEKLKTLLEIKERYEANEAKKAYHEAMTAFKANPPKINKDMKVSFGQTKYSHASLANVTEKISAELSKHGLSAAWKTAQNGQISVTCRITHILGHGEETTISAPADKSGSKNDIQAIGSTITYLQRYSLLALCGLATFENEDDGAATETISEKELSQLRDLMADKDVNEAKFCEYLKVESLDGLLKSKYQQAVAAVNAKKKK